MKLVKRIDAALEKWAPAHRGSLLALFLGYTSSGVVGLIGSIFRWDGQAAIATIPFVLVLWLAFPASIILALVGIQSSPVRALALCFASSPFWGFVFLNMDRS